MSNVIWNFSRKHNVPYNELVEFVHTIQATTSEADRVSRDVPTTTGWVAKKDWYSVPVLFNPYTGEPRDVRDIQSDPQGILIAVPGAQMLAASPQPQPVQAQQKGCFRCVTPNKCAIYGCCPGTWPSEQPANQQKEE